MSSLLFSSERKPAERALKQGYQYIHDIIRDLGYTPLFGPYDRSLEDKMFMFDELLQEALLLPIDFSSEVKGISNMQIKEQGDLFPEKRNERVRARLQNKIQELSWFFESAVKLEPFEMPLRDAHDLRFLETILLDYLMSSHQRSIPLSEKVMILKSLFPRDVQIDVDIDEYFCIVREKGVRLQLRDWLFRETTISPPSFLHSFEHFAACRVYFLVVQAMSDSFLHELKRSIYVDSGRHLRIIHDDLVLTRHPPPPDHCDVLKKPFVYVTYTDEIFKEFNKGFEQIHLVTWLERRLRVCRSLTGLEEILGFNRPRTENRERFATLHREPLSQMPLESLRWSVDERLMNVTGNERVVRVVHELAGPQAEAVREILRTARQNSLSSNFHVQKWSEGSNLRSTTPGYHVRDGEYRVRGIHVPTHRLVIAEDTSAEYYLLVMVRVII